LPTDSYNLYYSTDRMHGHVVSNIPIYNGFELSDALSFITNSVNCMILVFFHGDGFVSYNLPLIGYSAKCGITHSAIKQWFIGVWK